MKFSTREDIEAPIAHVFDVLSEFRRYERQALRHDIDVKRVAGGPDPQIGDEWHIRLPYRGKVRQIKTVLVNYTPTSEMCFQSTTKGLSGECNLELVALAANQTRLFMSVELRPQNMSGRLLIQTLKLAKTRLTRKFKSRIAKLAERIESTQ